MRWLRTLATPVAAVALAVAITMAIRPYLGAAPFGLVFLAILASSALGGAAAGWTAVGLSLVAAATLLVEPAASSADVPILVALLVPGTVGGAIVSLVDRLHKGAARGHARRLEIERANRLVDTAFESVPGVIYLYDEQGRFLRWNRNFLKVSGYTDDELAGKHPLEFFRGDDIPRVREAIGRVFETGEGVVEAGFVAKDGRVVPYYFTGRRITLDGRPCLVGMGSDLSDRVEAEEELRRSEERYHSTVDSILEGCQLIGFDWRYLYLNDAAARHNRRPNAELLGQTMPECWPGIEATPVYALLRRCLEERVAGYQDIEFGFADGTSSWFEVRAQPVPEGVFVLSIDVTERHRAEAALLDAKANLERKVEERTAELQTALVRAEAADRIKSAFLATMSHELRTPLNSILGFTGIVLQGLAGPLTDEQRKQLGMVKGSARHLLDLINDVLDISKIEAGQLTIRAEPFDLRASVDRAVASMRSMADQKQIQLEVTMPADLAPMCSDRRRVEQILLNLLNNGVKFTERGRVSLTVEAGASVVLATGRPAVRIRVSDTGIGITPEDLRTLFQPFRQLDTGLARQHEGTGLGLAICRRLTELLGGEIGAESTVGAGSVFTVTLPLDLEP